MPTVIKLKEEAKKRGLKGYYKMNKDQLCTALGLTDDECYDRAVAKTKTSTPPAKTKTSTPPVSLGKKVKALKAVCIADTDNYVWVVGKGCFEKIKTNALPPTVAQKIKTNAPPRTVAPAKPRNNCTEVNKRESPSIANETSLVRGINCLELPLSQVKHILGPCSMYYFRIGSRNFYLFGEFHDVLSRSFIEMIKSNVTKLDSLTFSSFVHSLVKQNPHKTYDLMFEGSVFPKKTDAYMNILSNSPTFVDINFHYEPCIIATQRDRCPYKNLRTHYVDYRRNPDDPLINPTVFNLSQEEYKNVLLNLFKSRKIQKQLEAVKDSYIRKSIVKFFLDNLMSRSHSKFGIGIMDLYAFSRIFRDFDIGTKKSSQFSGTSENVIYYAGYHHVYNLYSFITKYLNIQPQYELSGMSSKPRVCTSFVSIDMKKAGFV